MLLVWSELNPHLAKKCVCTVSCITVPYANMSND